LSQNYDLTNFALPAWDDAKVQINCGTVGPLFYSHNFNYLLGCMSHVAPSDFLAPDIKYSYLLTGPAEYSSTRAVKS